MLVFNEYLYYEENDNLYRLNLIDKRVELLINSYSVSCIFVSEEFIWFYDKEDKTIYSYNLNNKNVEKALGDIDNLSILKIIGDFLYFRIEDDDNLLKVVNLKTKEIGEYNVVGSIYSFDNIPYVLNNGKTSELKFE